MSCLGIIQKWRAFHPAHSPLPLATIVAMICLDERRPATTLFLSHIYLPNLLIIALLFIRPGTTELILARLFILAQRTIDSFRATNFESAIKAITIATPIARTIGFCTVKGSNSNRVIR